MRRVSPRPRCVPAHLSAVQESLPNFSAEHAGLSLCRSLRSCTALLAPVLSSPTPPPHTHTASPPLASPRTYREDSRDSLSSPVLAPTRRARPRAHPAWRARPASILAPAPAQPSPHPPGVFVHVVYAARRGAPRRRPPPSSRGQRVHVCTRPPKACPHPTTDAALPPCAHRAPANRLRCHRPASIRPLPPPRRHPPPMSAPPATESCLLVVGAEARAGGPAKSLGADRAPPPPSCLQAAPTCLPAPAGGAAKATPRPPWRGRGGGRGRRRVAQRLRRGLLPDSRGGWRRWGGGHPRAPRAPRPPTRPGSPRTLPAR